MTIIFDGTLNTISGASIANTAITDIAYRILDNLENSEPGQHDLSRLSSEFGEIMRYCNEIFKDISFTYNTVQYGFDYLYRIWLSWS